MEQPTNYPATLAQVRTALAQIVEMIGNLDEPAPAPADVRLGLYGEAPVHIAGCDLTGVWDEFMHYLYLPVRIPGRDHGGQGATMAFPKRLRFMEHIVTHAMRDAMSVDDRFVDPYVYLTMRRGFATPGSPLNRPGWHCDDFGGLDLNYIWADRFPTRFLMAPDGLTIPEDDAASMEAFQALAFQAAETNAPSMSIEEMQPGNIFRLSPYVIHDTPVIPEPGGMRSFFKVSVSNRRYNLLGNSHNHDLDYDWEMHDREVVRNQPGAERNRDYWESGPGSKPIPFPTSTSQRAREAYGITSEMCGHLLWSVHPNAEHESALHVRAICHEQPHDPISLHSDGSESWGNVAPPPDDLPLCNHPERP